MLIVLALALVLLLVWDIISEDRRLSRMARDCKEKLAQN